MPRRGRDERLSIHTSGPQGDNGAIGALEDRRSGAVPVVGSVPDRPAPEFLGDMPVVVAPGASEPKRFTTTTDQACV